MFDDDALSHSPTPIGVRSRLQVTTFADDTIAISFRGPDAAAPRGLLGLIAHHAAEPVTIPAVPAPQRAAKR